MMKYSLQSHLFLIVTFLHLVVQTSDTSLGIQKVDTTSVGQITVWLDKIRIRK